MSNPNVQQHEIDIPSSSHDQAPQSPALNLPFPDLLLGSRESYNDTCVPLYNAAISDDLKAVEKILNYCPELAHCYITENNETVLHIAVLGTSYSVLKYLLSFMETEDLALQNADGQTALCLAAIKGVVIIAKLLVNKNKALLDIPTSEGKMPLYLAAFFRNLDMVRYLFSVRNINGGFSTHERGWLLLKCIEANWFGMALHIVENHPELAIDGNVIRVLARKPKAFEIPKPSLLQQFLQSTFQVKLPSQAELVSQKLLTTIWTNIMRLPKAEVDEIIRGPADPLEQNDVPPKYSSHVLFIAAERGNTAFVADLIRRYPHIVSEVNDNNQTIFHVAVLHRNVGIYMLLHEIGMFKDSIITLEDKNCNNMLHLAGMLLEEDQVQHIPPHQPMRGVRLRMQRELLWFQEVKARLPPSFQESKNSDGLTPSQLFTKNSRYIVSQDKEWLKGTVEQLMVVGALTASVSFAASITFAGGYNQNTGSPMFLSKPSLALFLFLIGFSVANSCLAILVGLSILTLNITEEDFLIKIPEKLTTAMASIFGTVVSLPLALLYNFLLLYGKKSKYAAILLYAMLIGYYVVLWQLADVSPLVAFNSRPSYFFDHEKRILYKPNTHI